MSKFNDAKNLFENGFKNFEFQEFHAVAKYLIFEMGYTSYKTEKTIHEMLSSQGVNTIPIYDSIHKSVLWAKSPLNKVENVIFTEKEIENIKNIDLDKYARILWAVLFLSKKDNNPDYYNRNLQEAVSISGTKLKLKSEEGENFLHWMLPYLECILGTRNLRIHYSDQNSLPVLEIGIDESPMKYFPKFCRICGSYLIKKSSNHQKICDNCRN